ncbi:cupin domain-containing protein [Halomonas janggokensis]|uniref:Cupin domain-containing protein n=1 Tax=Vreelandella janggokensis TaxID=370767 RepID=A0ABT4IRJ4_9GAMM|nr:MULTISPECIES: cupin domain-containing protein [Halomonas]MCZ0925853.1 cupin domain-containing protein [Halomonas janggokensis]MCZ0930920.1 cupin domain-containing protein [Halomonas janggokensis]
MKKFISGSIENISLSKLISLLPEQGCVELQRDGPKHTHNWHKHETDETLIIIQGNITFGIESKEVTCGPGEYVVLPAGTLHKSTASNEGCVYTICFRDVLNWLS